MNAEDVLKIHNLLKNNGVTVWVDGGWCVDALLGKQTREHPDLDIAVARSDAGSLRHLLAANGYKEEPRNDSTEWNYVLANDADKRVDVHVFEFDEQGNNIYGIEYPKDSLTGRGVIAGQEVRCISPEWMFKFKTAYTPKEKDLHDTHVLAQKFGFIAPESHRAP